MNSPLLSDTQLSICIICIYYDIGVTYVYILWYRCDLKNTIYQTMSLWYQLPHSLSERIHSFTTALPQRIKQVTWHTVRLGWRHNWVKFVLRDRGDDLRVSKRLVVAWKSTSVNNTKTFRSFYLEGAQVLNHPVCDSLPAEINTLNYSRKFGGTRRSSNSNTQFCSDRSPPPPRHREKLTTPQTYRVKPTPNDGLKRLLCNGPDTPGGLKIKNLTNHGLRIKIFRTSANTPFTTFFVNKQISCIFF